MFVKCNVYHKLVFQRKQQLVYKISGVDQFNEICKFSRK